MTAEFPPPDFRRAGKVKVARLSAQRDTLRVTSQSGSEATGVLVSRCAAEIPPEKIEWLWPSRLARGKHTCIAGEPGTGKSQLSIAVIAAVTTAGQWPCDEGQAPLGSAIILSAEDGASDTIVPRLLAAGADLNRVHVVSAVRNNDGSRRALNLQADLNLLERKIADIGDVAVVVVDPVSSYLGKTDSNKNSEVRGVLEPLSEMAERTRVAILSVTHFSKAGANSTTKALHRFIGSIAFTGAPRAAFAVIEDAEHDGRRLFLHAKNNLARPPQGLALRWNNALSAKASLRHGFCGKPSRWRSPPTRRWQPTRRAPRRGRQKRTRWNSYRLRWPMGRCRRPRSIAWRASMA
jgi:putative DNA primase/helicase